MFRKANDSLGIERRLIFTCIIMVACLFACSCNGTKKIDLTVITPDVPELQLCFQANWGSELNDVGYADALAMSSAGHGALAGPSDFAVDADDNLFINDCFNERYLRYSAGNNQIVAVGLEKFEAPASLISGDKGLMYLLIYKGTRIELNEYCFERDVLTTVALPLEKGGNRLEYEQILHDENSTFVIASFKESGKEHKVLFKVDFLTASIVEERELPQELGSWYVMDSKGNMFFIKEVEGDASEEKAIIRISRDNRCSRLAWIKCNNESEYVTAVQALDNGKLAIEYEGGSFKPKVIIFEPCSGEETTLDIGEVLSGETCILRVSKAGEIYFTERRLIVDDVKEDPFRIYKLQMNWGQES